MKYKIEWTGQASLFGDPRFQMLKLTGRITDQMLNMYRVAARQRVYRVTGRSIRRLLPGDPVGLSRSYQWGPEPDSYIQEVEAGDWRLIQESTARAEFRDVTNGGDEIPINLPATDIQYVREEKFTDFKEFVRVMREGR